MATYRQIQEWVREKKHYAPKTCWIAHVLSDHGLTVRSAPNRPFRKPRRQPCPDTKRPDIELALRHFKMIGENSN
jgi:hypothetical protein